MAARRRALSGKASRGASASVTLLKLGGSLITDKASARTVAEDHVRRLAAEIAAGWSGGGLVIGHGSGSFGHPEARAAGLAGSGGESPDRAPDPLGVARTQSAAHDLHRTVVRRLVDAGVPAYSQPPSGFLVAAAGTPRGELPASMAAALDGGLVPVTMGDVLLDVEDDGPLAAIASTETVFTYLAPALGRWGFAVGRVLWLGVTPGVLDRDGRPMALIDESNIEAAAAAAGGSAAVDVTGGMAHRLAVAWQLARRGIESLILDGRRPGSLESALDSGGETPPEVGTLVCPAGGAG